MTLAPAEPPAHRSITVGVAVLAMALLATTVPFQRPAGAATPVTIRLVGQSRVTRADGTATFTLAVSGAPEGAELTASVYPRLADDPSAMADALRGSFVGDPFRPVLEKPLADLLAADGTTHVELPTARDDTDNRLRLRETGVYPVRITVRSTKDRLAELVTFITRADPTASSPRLAVSLVVDTGDAVLLQPGRNVVQTDQEAARLAAFTEFSDRHQDVPLTLAVQPESVTSLGQNEAGRALADRLAAVGRRGEVIADTFVNIDASEAVRDGLGDEYRRQLELGREAITAWLGSWTDRGVRLLRKPLDDAGVELLRANGMKSVVLPAATTDLPARQPLTGPQVLQWSNGSQQVFAAAAITSATLSNAFNAAPSDAQHSGDQTLAATVFLAQLDHLALGNPTDEAPRGVIVLSSTSATPGWTFLDTLARGLVDADAITVPRTLSDLLERTPPMRAGPLLAFRHFVARPSVAPQDIGGAIALVRLDLEQLRSLTPSAATLADPEPLLAIAASTTLDDAQRNAYLDAAKAPFEPLRSAVQPPARAHITLNGGRGSFPLTLRSTITDQPITVRIHLRSSRATFPANDRVVTLQDGVWHDNIEIDAREGRYDVVVELFPPIGDRKLTEGTIDVQAVNLEGGVWLSALFLVLLAVWWVNSARRRRRRREPAPATD